MADYQAGSLEAFQEIYIRLAVDVRRYLVHLADGSQIADRPASGNLSSVAPVESGLQPRFRGQAVGIRLSAQRVPDESARGAPVFEDARIARRSGRFSGASGGRPARLTGRNP